MKHKPTNKISPCIDGKVYICNRISGIVDLPKEYPQFNPIEKPKKKVKKVEE